VVGIASRPQDAPTLRMRSRSSSPSPACIAAWLLVGLSSTLAIGAPGVQAEPPVPHPLAAFEPFVGKTWKGLVDPDKEVYDVARWERAVAARPCASCIRWPMAPTAGRPW
jgi:hypothetical protein